MYSVAYCIDMLGNVLLQVPMNLLFVKMEGYSYGYVGETISSATGKNEKEGTLTREGRWFTAFLSLCFGKNHAINSIQNNF